MTNETASSILAQVQQIREKQANGGYAAPAEAFHNARNASLRSEAWGDVGRVALAGLGIGAGARGLMGLVDLLKQNTKPKKHQTGPTPVEIPYPVRPVKTANALTRFLSGQNATSKLGIPLYHPAIMAAALGSAGLGWHGIDQVMTSRHKTDTNAELEAARNEFRDALLGRYSKPLAAPKTEHHHKAAEDASGLGHDLDRLYDGYVKQAKGGIWDSIVSGVGNAISGETAGHMAGLYGLYALPAAVGVGKIVYDKTRKRQEAAVLDAAIKRRERRRFMQSPTELYASPVPVEVGEDHRFHAQEP